MQDNIFYFDKKLYADLEACVNTLKSGATNCVMASGLERQLEYFPNEEL